MNKTGARNTERSFFLRKKGPVRTIVHTLVLGFFLFYSIGSNITAALASPAVLARTGSAGAGPRDIFTGVDVHDVRLPDGYGFINDRYAGSSDKVLIHVQDAHCEYSVQTAIKEILLHLNKEYSIDVVNLEGGAGEYDLSMFTRINDGSVREKVSDYFLKQGIISGAEDLAVNSAGEVKLWGAEDKDLYLNNLRIYRGLLNDKGKIDSTISGIESGINDKKQEVYSDELFKLDQMSFMYRSNEKKVDAYAAYLYGKAAEKGISPDEYSNISLVKRAGELERRIDFGAADSVREEFIQNLEHAMSYNEVLELKKKIEVVLDGRTRQSSFYKYLVEKADELGVDDTGREDLYLFEEYVAIYDKVDLEKLNVEIYDLEGKIAAGMFLDEEDKGLFEYSRRVELLERFFDIKMSRDEYSDFVENDVGEFRVLEKQIEKMRAFYEFSFLRDEAFIKNLRFSKSNAAVLVTGGFHSKNLYRRLKELGISYISITPVNENTGSVENNYYKILSGDVDPVSKAVSFLSSKLQIASILNEIAEDAWKSSDRTWFKVTAYCIEEMVKGDGSLVILNDNARLVRLILTPDGVRVEKTVGNIGANEEVIILKEILYKFRDQDRFGSDLAKIADLDFPEGEDLTGTDRLMFQLRDFILAPDGERGSVVAGSDFHGKEGQYNEFTDAADETGAQEVIEGDIIDRGTDGLKILRDIIERKKDHDLVTLMGNHELMFITAYMGDETAFLNYLANGGVKTLIELGYPLKKYEERFSRKGQAALNEVVTFKAKDRFKYWMLYFAFRHDPRVRSFVSWMQENLDLYHIDKHGTFYVHAGVAVDEEGNVAFKYLDKTDNVHYGVAALAILEEEMKQAFSENDLGARALRFLGYGQLEPTASTRFDKVSPLWIRSVDSRRKIEKSFHSAVNSNPTKMLGQLGGFAAMAVGHWHYGTAAAAPYIVHANKKVFFLAHGGKESMILYNTGEELGFFYGTDGYTKVIDTKVIKNRIMESRKKAAGFFLALYKRYYDDLPGSVEAVEWRPRPVAELRDIAGNVPRGVLVEKIGNASNLIKLVDAETGGELFDKNGMPIEKLPVDHGKDLRVTGLKFGVVLELAAISKILDRESVEYKIARGAMNILKKTKVHSLALNRHPVLAFSDVEGRDPVIYVKEGLIKFDDIFTITLFNQAAEIYLSRHPEMLPEGVAPREYLEEELGIQKKIFGEMYDEYVNSMERLDGGHLTHAELRYIEAIVNIIKGSEEEGKDVLLGRKKTTGLTRWEASGILYMIDEYENLIKQARLTHDPELILSAELHETIGRINGMLEEEKIPLMKSIFGGDNWQKWLLSPRVKQVLESLRDGYTATPKIVISKQLEETVRISEVLNNNYNSKYRNGAVLDLLDDKEIIVVGDLHGRLDNLKGILWHNNNYARIKRGEVILLIDGDAVHPDMVDYETEDELKRKLSDMGSSLRINRFILQLMRENPDNVFYVAGNHDFLSDIFHKEGVSQGVEYEKALKKEFGDLYVENYNKYAASLPIMARTNNGLTVLHAAPFKGNISLEEIRGLDVSDMGDTDVFNALFYRYEDEDQPDKSYNAKDVDAFLSRVGGKVLVVGHNAPLVPDNGFYSEIIPGKHYITYAAGGGVGYLSYKDGKLSAVDVHKNITSEFGEDDGEGNTDTSPDTDPSGDVDGTRDAGLPDNDGEEDNGIMDEDLRKRFKNMGVDPDEIKILDVLGDGMNATVYKVKDAEGKVYALKIAGGILGGAEETIDIARENIKKLDVMTAMVVQEDSRDPKIDFIPEIYYAAVSNGEPYVALEIIEDYREIKGDLFEELSADEIRSIVEQITGIAMYFESKGLMLWDENLTNFVYKDGKVILLDLGTFFLNKRKVSSDRQKLFETLGLNTPEYDGHTDTLLAQVSSMFLEGLAGTQHEATISPQVESIVEATAREKNLEYLYAKSGDVVRNARFRENPVVVFVQETSGLDAGQEAMVRELEKDLQHKYHTDNLRVMFYDGTEAGLEMEVVRAKEILDLPGAKAVAYVPSELHPGEKENNMLYIKDDYYKGMSLSLVGPRIALALGLVDYANGKASDELLLSMERLVRALSGDQENMNNINTNGIEKFLDDLLKGISALKAERINLEGLRRSIEAQEKMLTYL